MLRFAKDRGWRIVALLGILALAAAYIALGDSASRQDRLRTPLSASATDMGMYHRIANGVANGGSYYAVAAREHRASGYPLSPAIVVRPPLLAELTAALGWKGAGMLARALAIGTALAWGVTALRAAGPTASVIAGVTMLGAGFLAFYHTQLYHELWAGFVLALAAAVYRRDRPWYAAALALIAICFRETAILFPMAFGICALARRDWRGVAAWLACGIAAAALLVAHALAVESVLVPSDRTSPGWVMAPGLDWALGNLSGVSLLRLTGSAGPLIVLLAMAGWLGYRRAGGEICLFLLALLATLTLLARPDNYYWAFLGWPLLAGGLAFLPGMAIHPLRARISPPPVRSEG